MKLRSVYVLIILFAITVASCQKKDKKANNSIVGQWNGTQMELKFQQGPLTFDSVYQIEPPDYYKLNFKTQNQVDIDVNFQGDQGKGTGYYVTQGDQLTLAENENVEDSDKSIFTYKVSGNKLTLTTSSKDTIDNQVITGQQILYLERQ